MFDLRLVRAAWAYGALQAELPTLHGDLHRPSARSPFPTPPGGGHSLPLIAPSPTLRGGVSLPPSPPGGGGPDRRSGVQKHPDSGQSDRFHRLLLVMVEVW